ncbi:MAG TPA: type I-E CRISPR-associated protein Cse1/CasA [Cellvibrio sp.]|nr:type I-E CRISPR-associated protein Cse1/CasA [Cellvibrio sp.]
MNLINDPWIPVIRADGQRCKIAPWQITEVANPVVDIVAPRPDFQGALYQFLIGLLQTTFAPEEEDQWLAYWQNPPSSEQLKEVLTPFASAFELINSEGAAFLQDFTVLDDEPKELAALLIDAPGGKTRKDHLDHFVKGGVISGACASCTASALFALQTNAPSGGVGHRVGLRGGGPLTSLLLPENPQATLWQKLWLNVLTEDELIQKAQGPDPAIFPWLAPTRLSDKTGGPTLPGDVHDLQMYWGMPRRIRLESSQEAGACDLCGETSVEFFSHFRTKNYGVNYEGPWIHSLTPYRFDIKNEQPPLSLKGQPGGLGYRHWLGLVWADLNNGDKSARIIKGFYHSKVRVLDSSDTVKLWSFGYDMDNMKARCWYEQTMPVIALASEYRELFFRLVADLLNAARDVIKELRSQVKAGWFSRPKEVKGDTSMIDQSFWQATEPDFYKQLNVLAEQPETTRHMPAKVANAWRKLLIKQAIDLFDYWVLEGDAEDMDMKRITAARRFLIMNLTKLKSLQYLAQLSTAEEVA